jgi:hypothetical protein
MDDAKAVRRAALNVERIHQEARQCKNMCQEGTLGALPQGYGIKAPRVAGSDKEWQRGNQDVCDLLAQNPRSQNDHFCPIILAGLPPHLKAQAGAVHAGMVVTPVPVRGVEEGAVHPLLLFSNSRSSRRHLRSCRHSKSS